MPQNSSSAVATVMADAMAPAAGVSGRVLLGPTRVVGGLLRQTGSGLLSNIQARCTRAAAFTVYLFRGPTAGFGSPGSVPSWPAGDFALLACPPIAFAAADFVVVAAGQYYAALTDINTVVQVNEASAVADRDLYAVVVGNDASAWGVNDRIFLDFGFLQNL